MNILCFFNKVKVIKVIFIDNIPLSVEETQHAWEQIISQQHGT